MGIGRRDALRAGVGVAAAGTLGVVVGAGGSGQGTEPEVLVAGSLAGVADDVPGGAVEAHGSLAARRLVAGGAREPDAMALADPSLFAGLDGVEGVSLFATNALVLAYDPDSEHAGELREDWTAAVTDPSLRVGRTDPVKDPLGYRTLLALRLAARRGTIGSTEAGAFLDRSKVFPETALLQQLAVGKLDAAFAYRNMAAEVDVPAVDLPRFVDLSDPRLSDEYAAATVTVDGRTFEGSVIRYGAAALSESGREWVRELVEGRERLRDHGFTVPDAYPRRVPPGDR